MLLTAAKPTKSFKRARIRMQQCASSSHIESQRVHRYWREAVRLVAESQQYKRRKHNCTRILHFAHLPFSCFLSCLLACVTTHRTALSLCVCHTAQCSRESLDSMAKHKQQGVKRKLEHNSQANKLVRRRNHLGTLRLTHDKCTH